jgi:threonyl-tRNA synthetase
MPEKFDLFYIDKKGKRQRPVMLHRTILGSIERFIGILIENYGGEFPLWLAPVQVAVIPIKEKNVSFARKVFESVQEKSLRVELWSGEDTLSKKIKKAEEQKIPFVLVIGDKEEKSKKVAVRQKKKGDLGKMTITEFCDILLKEIKK